MTLHEACTILGVASTASPNEVRRAYRELVQVCHPDRFDGQPSLSRRANALMAHVNAAYELLQSRPGSARPPNPQPPPPPRPTPSPPRPRHAGSVGIFKWRLSRTRKEIHQARGFKWGAFGMGVLLCLVALALESVALGIVTLAVAFLGCGSLATGLETKATRRLRDTDLSCASCGSHAVDAWCTVDGWGIVDLQEPLDLDAPCRRCGR